MCNGLGPRTQGRVADGPVKCSRWRSSTTALYSSGAGIQVGSRTYELGGRPGDASCPRNCRYVWQMQI